MANWAKVEILRGSGGACGRGRGGAACHSLITVIVILVVDLQLRWQCLVTVFFDTFQIEMGSQRFQSQAGHFPLLAI